MARPILTNDVALTIAKALRFARNELYHRMNQSRDPKIRQQISEELQTYDLALLWVGTQTLR